MWQTHTASIGLRGSNMAYKDPPEVVSSIVTAHGASNGTLESIISTVNGAQATVTSAQEVAADVVLDPQANISI